MVFARFKILERHGCQFIEIAHNRQNLGKSLNGLPLNFVVTKVFLAILPYCSSSLECMQTLS